VSAESALTCPISRAALPAWAVRAPVARCGARRRVSTERAGAADERGLVVAARAGDRAAFARLYESYASAVHGVLLAHAPSADVGDLVQETFLLALRGIDRLDEPERFAGWLATIARNVARDAAKRRRNWSELDDDPPARREPGADADGSARALAAVRGLPEAYRETLMLRLVEGMSGPEISARTGLTPGSVRVNLCRGMKLLRERLARGGA
jgi:RNA polymerase sigma-70 factor (ECF subfamily)